MIKKFSELPSFLKQNNPTGCFVDTSILVSATYDLDLFHEAASEAFDFIAEAKVAPFTNINVRAEFLEGQRRILIPECLVDFLEDFSSELDERLLFKLQSHRTLYRRRITEKKSVKMDINQIKIWRDLLSNFTSEKGNGWDIFCRNYFSKKITPLWSWVVEVFNMNFISIRSNDENEFLNSIPHWEEATAIIGRHGLGSGDAMILNMFLCSKLPILITADLEMAHVADRESNGAKTIFIPDSRSYQEIESQSF